MIIWGFNPKEKGKTAIKGGRKGLLCQQSVVTPFERVAERTDLDPPQQGTGKSQGDRHKEQHWEF